MLKRNGYLKNFSQSQTVTERSSLATGKTPCFVTIWNFMILIAITASVSWICLKLYESSAWTLLAVLLSVGCCFLSCSVVYLDSAQPGIHPPSPVSPYKRRQKSGHTFHLTYTMCALCGLAVLFCSLATIHFPELLEVYAV